MIVTMQDIDINSLFKRVQEKEGQGYECVFPITPKRTICKNYNYNDSAINKNTFSGFSQSTMYFVKMRKVL